MARSTCRKKSRRRARLPEREFRDGARKVKFDIRRADALRAFEERTGVDPRTDGRLALLMQWVRQGIAANELPGRERTVLTDAAYSDDYASEYAASYAAAEAVGEGKAMLGEHPAGAERRPIPPKGKGRPPMHPNLRDALRALVGYLGNSPTDVALALELYGLHPYGRQLHPATARDSKRAAGERSMKVALRRIERRLAKI